MENWTLGLQILITGLVATAVLDLWQRLVAVAFGVPASNWALVGRWFSHIPRGTLLHAAIGASEPVRCEAAVGWVAHYVVGVAYAAAYLALVGFVLDSRPTLMSALGFGVTTVLAPWFVLQPGMGLGVLASRAPSPAVVRAHSLSSHLAFGGGLYVASSMI